MSFNAPVIDVSVYQGVIDWAQVKASGIYATVIRAGYGRYADQEDIRFKQNYDNARAAGMPVGIYWFSYAKTADEARLEADICLQVLGDRALQMPLYMDQENTAIPAANRTACAVAFLDRIRERWKGLVGYYTYTAYFSSVDIPTIQQHSDTIWLADYRANYNKDIPRDMHQYSSSGSVPGIGGRVDMNNLYRDFPNEIEGGNKPVYTSDTLRVGPASTGDLKTMRTLAESLVITVQQDGDYLIIGPMSAGDRATISNKALELGLGCEDYTEPTEPVEPTDPEEPEDSDTCEALKALAEAVARIEANQKMLVTATRAMAQALLDNLKEV